MRMLHVAQVSSSEENSDRFFRDLLGLNKQPPKILSAELSKGLFKNPDEFKMIYYGNEHIIFEIFIADRSKYRDNRPDHVCLEVEDRDSFLHRCAEAEIEVRTVKKGESEVVFICDFDGNLYEIKEKQKN